jgi:hypothetical protein
MIANCQSPNKETITMTNTAIKTYRVAVIERAVAYYEVEAEDARAAAENWEEGEFKDRNDEALDSEGPCSVREQQPDGTWRKLSRSEWEVQPVAATGNKPYSVLLHYPDYLDDTGYETYYAFVEALDSIDAIAVAQREAVREQVIAIDDPTDFIPLLVTEGHHYGQPLLNN